MRPARSHALAVATTSLLTAAPALAQAHPPLHVNPTLEDCSVQFAPTLTQRAFARFVREFGSVSAFKQAASTATLGRGRVLFGVELLRFRVDEYADAWNDTFYHPNADHPLGARKDFPKLKLRAGVTDDVDVGAFYTRNPNANYGWLGVDAKYRVRRDDASPLGAAVRGAYTRTLYVRDMDMHALTADLSLSRRLGRVVHPYAGVGADVVLTRETSDVVALRRENKVVPHVFGGFDAVVWGRLSVGAELAWGARPTAHVHVGGIAF